MANIGMRVVRSLVMCPGVHACGHYGADGLLVLVVDIMPATVVCVVACAVAAGVVVVASAVTRAAHMSGCYAYNVCDSSVVLCVH